MKKARNVFWILLCLLLLHVPLSAAGGPPEKGKPLPDVSLPVPEDPAQRAYLGLDGGASFKIPQIKARVVIIEIFSMYCPYCQREAPAVNRLYGKIEGNPRLKGKIKLIGIGAGNSPFEVNVFRKKYDIAFPLFSDENYALHRCFGEVRTPYFIAVRLNPDGSNTVFDSELGGLHGVDRFLESILALSGLTGSIQK